jgi:acyl transferase domain-containing protein/NADP-dependent 3-hydroxy acid dehydrogenase YdfG/SAM-dependent methyltransferase/acyl carrier protein
MSDFLERIGKLSPKRLALLALELNEKLEAAGQRRHEPVAVVGMACRFPGGADDPERYWELLRSGRDATREVPADRWDVDAWFDPDEDVPGRMSVRRGGFLDRLDGFDAAFFGISPREAQTLDPQQRLLLEVAWEALEDAGLSADRLAGSATGVFVGLCNSDHFLRALGRGAGSIDTYVASGNAHSVAAGRISYFLGLQGPAISVDTACSSSLVSLHLACQSLRSGESRVALSGGVNVMCAPETTVALTKGHMLAPDGRCKTFDAAADGFARGEGCGMLVLKRLSDAVADGDRVLAVIRGTAVNQDGRSGGLTVPNGPAQEAVIRAALADAGVQPADIGYVEAHGTGTSLGDPIEVRALAGALGTGRPEDDPLLIGSAKTNLGHLESAAGVAGVMKVVLSLQHQRIPPHLHFHHPNPHIAWAEYPVAVAPEGRAWPRGARRRLAGVSSFGFSGTNAHVILEEAPTPEPVASVVDRPLHCVPISARTGEALSELAAGHAAVLAQGRDLPLADVAHTAGAGRAHFAERLAVVARDASEARDALAAFGRGDSHPGLHRGSAVAGQAPEVVFLYTGQGAQYAGMGRLLHDTSPVYRETIDRCDAILGADPAGRTLKDVLHGAQGDDALIHQTSWTQPALFAVEMALTQLWRSWGVEPSAVIGHSVGEYAAACAAGVFTLEEGLRLISERGRLMHGLAPGGTMAAVFAPVEDVAAAVAPMADRLAIAAVNAPDSVVVSGDAGAVEALLAGFARRDVQGHRLFISLAAHSPLVDPALDAMEAAARAVPMRAPRIPVAWNLTGGAPLPGGAPDATYWRRHLREPVRFGDGIARLHREGHRVFVEMGPHPVLVALAQRTLPVEGTRLLGSLRRGHDDWAELTSSLAELYVLGAPVDWAGVDRPYPRRRVVLPTYPFQRRRFWIESGERARVHAPAGRARGNPLLGERLSTAVPVFEATLLPDSAPYLADHRLNGAVLLAGPVFLEMAQAAAREVHGARARAVEGFAIHQPLVVPDEGRVVQTHLGPAQDGAVPFSIHARSPAGDEWLLHATGRLVAAEASSGSGVGSPADPDLARTLGTGFDLDAHYLRLEGMGIQLGASFRSMVEAGRRDGEALVAVALPGGREGDAVAWAHPSLLDGALQAVGLAMPVPREGDDLYLFSEVERIEVPARLPSRFRCHARLRDGTGARPGEIRADVALLALDGTGIGLVRGVSLRRASVETLARATGGVTTARYEVSWQAAPIPPRAAGSLEDPARLVPALRDRFPSIAAEQGLSLYEQLLPELDRLSVEHLAVALRQLGFDATPGRTFTPDEEAARLAIVARHRRLFARLLDILAEEGVLRRLGEVLVVAKPLPPADPAPLHASLLARFGPVDGELRMLQRCGTALAAVLRGEQDPLHLLFPGGSFDEARKLYVESPYARTYNTALGEALTAAIARLPSGARLRILEIGAGTGGTTTFLLPLLPADRVEYTFTDLSPLFLDRAAESFATFPFVRRALLDVERDPVTQGFEAGAYDVVIAANVLHATADLRQSLGNARRLLAPDGLLFLLEGVAPERWVDLTFGLTEGWWRFSDGVRQDYPLVGRKAWVALLGELGFRGAAAVPDDGWTARGGAQQALVVARAPAPQRRVALVGGPAGLVSALAGRLRRRGDEVVSCRADAAEGPAAPVDEVVYLGALELSDLPADDVAAAGRCHAVACESPLRWLGQMARGELSGRAWLVTRGGMPAGGPLSPGAAWQAPLWGAGRVFALEQPARWGGVVDLPASGDDEALASILSTALDAGDEEDQTAWRDGARLAARLVPAAPPRSPAVRFRADATYLVTGGFGGLGLLVARWMAERGARHLALLGRRPDPTADGVRAIEAMGATVHPLAGDVADEAALSALLQGLAAVAPPLRGVIHAAADFGASPIGELTPAQIETMLRPKIDGTLALDRVTRARNLDFLALFSSTTALLGASGLAHYAAANAFLDAFAHVARRAGRRVLSINWGTWEAMRLASAEDQRAFREGGLEPMPAAEALEMLGRLLAEEVPQAVVARVDWSILRPLHEARRARPFLSRLHAVPTARAQAADAGPSLAERLEGVPADARHDRLVEFVRGEVAAVLQLGDAETIPPDTGLFDLGMDSLMSVELRRRLERGAGRSLPSTLTFNYPSVAALAGFLERELAGARAAQPAAPPPPGPATPPPPAADDLDRLSDDELEARLRARLERNR